jgi:hypothetical protein
MYCLYESTQMWRNCCYDTLADATFALLAVRYSAKMSRGSEQWYIVHDCGSALTKRECDAFHMFDKMYTLGKIHAERDANSKKEREISELAIAHGAGEPGDNQQPCVGK